MKFTVEWGHKEPGAKIQDGDKEDVEAENKEEAIKIILKDCKKPPGWIQAYMGSSKWG
uniref:Uncharacterized protein n=1 Tax=viral metagenome TaxID=1070528 RepID=A0A6M3ISI9_9ZZZZ